MKTMTSKQAAEHIGVSINTLRKYVHEEGLPVLRFPGKRKWTFREDLVDEWMLKRSQPEVVVMSKPKEEKPKEYGRLRVLTP